MDTWRHRPRSATVVKTTKLGYLLVSSEPKRGTSVQFDLARCAPSHLQRCTYVHASELHTVGLTMSYTHERTARHFIGTASGKIPQAAPRGGSKRETFEGNHLGAKFLPLPLAAPQATSKAHARGDAGGQSCAARARSERASSAIDRVQFTHFSFVFIDVTVACGELPERSANEAVLESLRKQHRDCPKKQRQRTMPSYSLHSFATTTKVPHIKYLPGTPQRNNAEQSSTATATPQQSLVAHRTRAAALRYGRLGGIGFRTHDCRNTPNTTQKHVTTGRRQERFGCEEDMGEH